MSFTYDAGALIAADRNDRRMMTLHYRLLKRKQVPTVPAPVLARTWRGGPQPELSRLLAGCRIDQGWTEADARSIGALCATAETSDVVDGLVVLTALERSDAVVSSDPQDLRKLAGAAGRRLNVVLI
jgi:hypothetical protein